jgi:hypothetical protein
MTKSAHILLHERAYAERVKFDTDRRRDLAHKLTRATVTQKGHIGRGKLAGEPTCRQLSHVVPNGEVTSDDVRVDILDCVADYKARSLGRRATGAHGTTSGGVWVGDRLVMRSVQTVVARVKCAKAHKAERVRACDQAHTRQLDAARHFARVSAPWRKGGYRWAKLPGVGKREYRKILHKCDRMVENGEITAALELLLGDRK